MILIGQYDSPFVRRVGIALRLYDMPFEQRPWSTFSDADEIAHYNPLLRVPTLVLDDGEVLIESGAILDHLDEVAGLDMCLIAPSGVERRHALKICALATGLADKAVSMFYERALHETASAAWLARCQRQIGAVLDALESERAKRPTPYWFGARIGHPDIAVACALRFVGDAHPQVMDRQKWPLLVADAAQCEAMDVFQEISQPFIPPS